MTQVLNSRVTWLPGPVSDAVAGSEMGRLRRFLWTEESEALVLFNEAHRAVSDNGDWYGEHVGKWLVAASHAFRRTEDKELGEAITRVVANLVANQETSGYLGTYAAEAACRFTNPGAQTLRTWDLWIHAWVMLGLLRTGHVEPARKIGDLLVATFPAVHPSVLDLGNHAGLSSSVILEPLAELTLATGDRRYVELAVATVAQMEARGLRILAEDGDVAELGTGKAYQICWTLTGLVAMYRATEDARYLRAAQAWWANIEAHHLTPQGGPWGGIGTHKEVFNAKGFFSPYGMVETCSAASWMALSRELFLVTGEERYVAAVERTLLNTILGAQDANGHDWCYFTFPNGRRNNTYHWACCKSSGALALEEFAGLAATMTGEGVAVNLVIPFIVRFEFEGASGVLRQTGDEERIRLSVELDEPKEMTVAVRIPQWAKLSAVRVGDEVVVNPHVVNGYLWLARTWNPGDRVEVDLDVPIRVTPYTHTVDHHGQEVVRMDYAYLSRGPYVYATGLIDGYRKEETLRLARLTPEAPFRPGADGEILLHQPGREPIPFRPYYEAGGRHDGAWRTTWLQVAWQ